MKRLSFVISIPGNNKYLSEQEAAARATAQRLGMELTIINAQSDPVTQSQQLLEIIQSRSTNLPDAILVEPVNDSGLPRVAEAAVRAGIGWIISNARVDYLEQLRKISRIPVFAVTQDHVEIGRIQGQQFGAFLPKGGTVLYLRGPAANSLATQRVKGLENSTPPNIQFKTLKIQWTEESAYQLVSSWLRLSTVRSEHIHIIAAQNIDFLFAAKRAFQDLGDARERMRWLNLPYVGAGVANQTKPLVDNGTIAAVAVTATTMDVALEIAACSFDNGGRPPEYTLVQASSYPALADLERKPATKIVEDHKDQPRRLRTFSY